MYGLFLDKLKIKMSLISIITPCYNVQNYLEKMINSVISQSYKNWELLIVDDCSSDNSIEIIKRFIIQDSRIKLLRLKNRSGPAFARNKAIHVADGRYLTFIDADDYWDNNFLKYSVKSIKNYSFIYSDYNLVDKHGKFLFKLNTIPKVNYDGVLKGTPISCLTAFIDLKKLGKKFFPLNVYREDIAYWLLLLKDCNYAYGFSFCEANYRYQVGSSSNKIKMVFQTWHDYRNKHDLSFLKSVYFFYYYIFSSSSKFFYIFLSKNFENLKIPNLFKSKK